MIQIQKNEFEKIVTAAASPTSGIFDSMPVYFARAEQVATEQYLGRETVEKASPELLGALKKFICLYGFLLAIPSLDLVLTETGFGVVSNQNVAPASVDRVRNLTESLMTASGHAIEQCVELCRGTAWADTIQAKRFISRLIYCSDQLPLIAIHPATRAKLVEMTGKFSIIERSISMLISEELRQRLLQGLRRNDLDEQEQVLMVYLTEYYASYLTYMEMKQPISNWLKVPVLRFLDENLEHFEIYKNSLTYKARMSNPYENRHDDTCYFF